MNTTSLPATEAALLEQYLPLVRRRAHTFRHASYEPEDLIQEGLLALLYAIRNFDPAKDAAFSTYAYRCITNRLCTTVGKLGEKKDPLLTDYTEISDDLLPSEFDPAELVILREGTQQYLSKLQMVLSAREWETLRRYLMGYSYAEMAQQLATSEKSVDNALQRIRRKVRTETEFSFGTALLSEN